MRNGKTWFIIIIYHPMRQLEELLDALHGMLMVVVDNTNQDQKSKIIDKQNKENINYIMSKTNTGYGWGANSGMRYAMERGAEWMVVLNQDIKMTKETVKELCERLRGLPLGIAGPFAGTLDQKRWTTILPASGKTIDYFSGACVAIHRDVIEKIGYFYEPYFMYYEDADYSVRAKKSGFPLVYIPLDGIKHIDAPSLGKGSFLHEYYLARNHLLFVERLAPVYVKCYEYLRLPKTIFEYLWRRNHGALAGYKDYFMRRFGEKRVT